MQKVCGGCGQAYEADRHKSQYCRIACMPRALKVAAARKGRAKRTQTTRLKMFLQDLRRLEGRVSRDDLMIVFAEIYHRGYQAGHRAHRISTQLRGAA
jgi:hypothetical protein